MKTIISLKALLVVGLFISACQPSTKTEDSADLAKENNDQVLHNRDDEKDADFVVNTMASSYAEIEIAKLAIERSTDEEVISLAKKVEAEHTTIIDELKNYAATKGIEVPVAQTDDQRDELNKLAEKDSANFDKEICEALKDDHEDTVSDFEKRIDKTEDPDLKSWISKTLPTLKARVEMLKIHEDKEKAEAKG